MSQVRSQAHTNDELPFLPVLLILTINQTTNQWRQTSVTSTPVCQGADSKRYSCEIDSNIWFFRFQSNLPTVSRPSWGFTGQTGLSGSRAAVRPVIRWPSGNQSCESLCRLNCVTEFRSADSQWRMCFILGSLWYDGLKAGVQTLLA